MEIVITSTHHAVAQAKRPVLRFFGVTVALANAVTVEQVADVIIRDVFGALCADTGFVALLDADQQQLTTVRQVGYPQEIVVPISAAADPVSDAARAGEPLFFATRASYDRRYPDPTSLCSNANVQAVAALPLVTHGEMLGVIGLSWPQPRRFRAEERAFLHSIANHCALAVECARFYDSTQQESAERKRAEETVQRLHAELELRVSTRTSELQAAVQELEAFSYSVSHDLRAPLRAIDGFSRILMQSYAAELPETAQHYLHRVRDNAQNMGRLIDELLSFSRLNRQALNRQTVAPDDLVRQALEELNAEVMRHPVDFRIAELPACHADVVLLRQVFVNLLSNALKFTRRRDPAIVEVGGRCDSGERVYFVKDNGVGFDMRYVDKLFGVFQRLHRMEDYEGTGVGLALVQRIIHRHGGRVWAEGAIDRGATFYFTLPEPALPETENQEQESQREESS